MHTYSHESLDFSFQYPERWRAESRDNIISVFDPDDGVGALQFSFLSTRAVGVEELVAVFYEYLDERHKTFTMMQRERYLEADVMSRDDGRIWRYWLFSSGSVTVLATYNCESADAGQENAEVDLIMESALEQAMPL